MKKIVVSFLAVFFVLLLNNIAKADEITGINLYLFYGEGCPHCAKEEEFLKKIESTNKNVQINRFEVWNNKENQALYKEISKKLNITRSGVPLLIIGNEYVVGYGSDDTTGKNIEELIKKYSLEGCGDEVAPILDNKNNSECVHGCDRNDLDCINSCNCELETLTENINNKAPVFINVPFIGEINAKNFSLSLLTLIIAATDGFNPCAMWVLLFLISLLLGMENKKRMWLLGMAFILSSGVVYFLFLTAWLNLFIFIGFMLWLRVLIGVVAIGSGSYHLYDWWKNKDGVCKVTNNEKRKKIFLRIRKIITEQRFWLSLLGIVLLAGAVNLVELVCSAGLPAVFTQVLAVSNLPTWQYYFYLIFYVTIFMLDDILVFIIAMKALELRGVSSKYTKYANLIGGIIILILGILLIFKPGWIMF